MKRPHPNKASIKGFTLIELLIVMLLISLSLSIIIPVLNRNLEKELLSCTRKASALLNFAISYTSINNKSIKVMVKNHEIALIENKFTIKKLKCPRVKFNLEGRGEGNFTVVQGTIPPEIILNIGNNNNNYRIKYELSERDVKIEKKK